MFGGWKLTHLPSQLRKGFYGLGAAFVAWYVGLTVRHFWEGPDLSGPGMSDGELYSYTIVMLLASVGALGVAFVQRSDWLRKVAMAAVGVTIAKVFLVDMSGLAGLIRVVSFMGLGLALVGLTWLNRVMLRQWHTKGETEAPPA